MQSHGEALIDRQTVSLPGAHELMRGLGLLVDGPVRWSAPVPSRAPGVFVVELESTVREAPIDEAALRRWLERTPQLRVHGERPSASQLAQHLARFWLPLEPVLYVGRSSQTLGGRVAALYATPLGDARPHAGGHWLKTLNSLNRLRLWWAETDAAEEYEDALLSEIGVRQPSDSIARLPDTTIVLPYANLTTTAGTSKAHGLEGALRMPNSAEQQAGRATPPTGTSPRRTAAGRAAPRNRAATPRPRRTATAPPPSAAAPAYLSPEGLQRLSAELEGLRRDIRPGVIERVKAARELGDLRENAEYESARKEQSFVEGRIQALEALLRTAVVVDANAAAEAAAIGSTVVVEAEGEKHTYQLVGSSEADPAAGRISYASPVGQALLGRRAGEEAVARLPGREIRYLVREVL